MSNGFEFEYITPGSPIEQYLASVGHDCESDDVVSSSTETVVKDPSLFAFFGKGFIFVYRVLIPQWTLKNVSVI